jgi:hypothetical protein
VSSRKRSYAAPKIVQKNLLRRDDSNEEAVVVIDHPPADGRSKTYGLRKRVIGRTAIAGLSAISELKVFQKAGVAMMLRNVEQGNNDSNCVFLRTVREPKTLQSKRRRDIEYWREQRQQVNESYCQLW